jgi:hypothetical protein
MPELPTPESPSGTPVARLRLARIFRLPGRGVALSGKIIEGMIRKGDTLRLSGVAFDPPIAVTAVEFLDCSSARQFEIAVVVDERAPDDAQRYAGLWAPDTVIEAYRDGVDELQEFIRQFEAGTLPKARWTHDGHLMAGFWYVWRSGFDAALPMVRARIREYNEAVGTQNTDQGGYHETLTRFFLLRIAALIQAQSGASTAGALAAVLQSSLVRRDAPLQHYSTDRLFSVAARRGWVEPDLAPLHGPAAIEDGHAD